MQSILKRGDPQEACLSCLWVPSVNSPWASPVHFHATSAIPPCSKFPFTVSPPTLQADSIVYGNGWDLGDVDPFTPEMWPFCCLIIGIYADLTLADIVSIYR